MSDFFYHFYTFQPPISWVNISHFMIFANVRRFAEFKFSSLALQKHCLHCAELKLDNSR